MHEWVLHIDGDGFFAYCEIARSPHLKGKPVVVGEDRGIACAMTSEAKALGITRGMPMFKIRSEYPQVVILSSHFELYEQYAEKLFSILTASADVVERYSIDECFALVRFPITLDKQAITTWLEQLKTRVQQSIGITYSFGIARTKVLAKIASKYQKPDGCTVIMPDDEEALLQNTTIESVWGIGRQLSKRFQSFRVRSAYEFAQWTEAAVTNAFALPIQQLWHELNGRSIMSVSPHTALPKSLQSTKSFAHSTEQSFVIGELLQNLDIAFTRMRTHNLMTNTVSMYLKSHDYQYYSFDITIPYYTDNPLAIVNAVAAQVEKIWNKSVKYRSTGVTVCNLHPKGMIQTDLFGLQESMSDARLMQAVDSIRKRHGHFSIGTLSTMPSTVQRRTKAAHLASTASYIAGLPLPYLGEVS